MLCFTAKVNILNQLMDQMDEEGHEPVRPTLAICAVDGLLAIFVCIITNFSSLDVGS